MHKECPERPACSPIQGLRRVRRSSCSPVACCSCTPPLPLLLQLSAVAICTVPALCQLLFVQCPVATALGHLPDICSRALGANTPALHPAPKTCPARCGGAWAGMHHMHQPAVAVLGLACTICTSLLWRCLGWHAPYAPAWPGTLPGRGRTACVSIARADSNSALARLSEPGTAP